MCGASGDLHATASDGREEAVRTGSTQAESDSVLEQQQSQTQLLSSTLCSTALRWCTAVISLQLPGV